MPTRNINVIMAIVILSLACYLKAERTRYAGPVGDAIFMIDRFYVDSIDNQKLFEGAMKGVVDQLDPYSQYIDQRSYGHFQNSLQQRFAGIGIVVEKPKDSQFVRVVTPLLDTPAFNAGVRPGDLIVKVDGESVQDLQIGDVSDKLRGPEGTEVAIELRRGKSRIVKVSVRRASISLESVMGDHRGEDNAWVFHLKEHPEIGYVRVSTFGEQTVSELKRVMKAIDSKCEGLIIDLRQNQGGLLTAAVEISDMFLDKGVIVSTRGRDGKIESEFKARHGVLLKNEIPMVVMVDGESASASEIVAACLQDQKRALIAGHRSFGKGTVQNVLPLELGLSALKLTTARYYRPNEKNIHRVEGATEEDEWGVSPNEGMGVTLTTEQQIRALKRLQRASFPTLPPEEGVAESETPNETSGDTESETTDPESVAGGDPATTEPEAGQEDPVDSTPLDSLQRDPQLLRAVEFLQGKLVETQQVAA